MAFRLKNRTMRRRTGGTRRTRKNKGVSKTVKDYVNRAIASNIENKRGSGEGSLTLGTYTATPVSQTALLAPVVSKGVEEYHRTGLQVKLKRAVLRGYIRPKMQADGTFYSVGEKLWHIRMVIGKPHNINSQSIQGTVPLNTGDLANMFRDGYDNKPFASNNPLCLLRPVNRNYWKICYDKCHRIGISSNGAATTQGLKADNNNYPINKFFTIDLTKHFKKKLIFDESSSYPQNDALWVSCHLMDIAGLNVGDTNCIDVSYYLDYEFEDA